MDCEVAEDDNEVETLTYGAVQESRSTGMSVLMIVMVGITACALFLAVSYPNVYENAIASRCGTGQVSAESFIWLTGLAGILLSVIGWRAGCRIERHRVYRFLAIRCVWINAASLMVPWLWALLDKMRLFG